MSEQQPNPPSNPLDLRLLPAAALAWLVTIGGIRFGWRFATGTAAALLVVGVVALTVPWLGRHSVAFLHVSRVQKRHAATVVVAAVVLGAGFAGAIAWRARAVHDHPLANHTGETVRATVVLDDDPRALPGTGFGGRRVVAAAELEQFRARGDTVDASGEVTVLAPVDGWTGLLPGQRVELRGTVRTPDRADLTVATLIVDGPPTATEPAPWWQRAAGSVRADFATAAERAVPGDEAALLPGLVIGDTSRLPDEIRDEFRTAGLSHLTAVSGANISILIGAVLLAVRLAALGPWLGALIAGLALVAFVILARPSPSVVRAAVMGAVGLLALVTGRRRQAMPALATAVLAALAIDPALAVDAGFALSVLATGGLIVLAPVWTERLRQGGWPRWLAEAVSVAMTAFVVTAPVVVALSGTVNPLSILANLLVVAVIPPITVIGAVAAGLSALWLPAGVFTARFAGPMLWWLLQVAERTAAVPDAALTVPGGAVTVTAATVGGLYLLRHRTPRRFATAVLLGAVAVLLPARCVHPGWPPPGWAMVACDVGQGDGLVLATGDGAAVVVDAGPEPGPMRTCLDRLGIDRIALVVLTHLHADHVGGLAGVLRGRRVAAIGMSGSPVPRSMVRDVATTAGANGVPLVELPVGAELTFATLRLHVLGPIVPVPRDPADADAAANDRSVVFAADTAAGRILLTGDVEESAQQALLRSGAPLRADILKVPHHGSRTSSPEFLAAVRPRLAVISVGADNTFGHPNPGIVDELGRLGATVVRTDRAGDIAVVGGERTAVVSAGVRRIGA